MSALNVILVFAKRLINPPARGGGPDARADAEPADGTGIAEQDPANDKPRDPVGTVVRAVFPSKRFSGR